MRLSRGFIVLVACFSAAFMAYGIRYTFGMLLPEMMGDLKLTNAQAALIYTAFLTSYTISSVFVGLLIDSFGIKRTVLTFLPLLGIGAALMSLVSTQLLGALFFAAAGVGASVCWVPLVLWVQKAYPSKRGWSVGVLQLGVNLGFATLGLITPMMILHLGWRGVWAFLGGLTLIWLLPLTAIAKEPDVNSHPHTTASVRIREFGSMLRDSRFWLGGTSYALSAFAIMVPMTFSKAYANLELGLNTAEATALFSIIGFTGIFSALSLSIISDKIGRKLSIVASNFATAAGLIGSAYLSASFTEIAIWSVIVGIGYSSIWPLYAALVKDLYSWEVAGSVTGLWTLFCGVGLLLSPYVSGILIDLIGSYRPAYMLSSVVVITATLIALKIRGGTAKR